ncbi:MAG: N-6 DNA methylase [Bacteroidota bacterium]|jgi:hypothetical protein
MGFNLKTIKQHFKEKGVFYTETALAELIKSYLPSEVKEVYDPTCGDGGLLSVFDEDVAKYGQELDADQLKNADQRLVNFKGISGDTLKNPAFMDKRFKAIVANPPFSTKWEPPLPVMQDPRFSTLPCFPPPSKADYAFIAHCLHLLDEQGMAVILCFPGILYRGNKEGEIRNWLIQKGFIRKVIRIPSKHFTDTNIETALIILQKNNPSTSITFEDLVLNKKATIPIEEILKNNGLLSVSAYIQPDSKQEKTINPLELNNLARKQMIKKLECDLQKDEWVCKLEDFDHISYCKELIRVIEEHIELCR